MCANNLDLGTAAIWKLSDADHDSEEEDGRSSIYIHATSTNSLLVVYKKTKGLFTANKVLQKFQENLGKLC